jgi:hypothetical protein
MVDDMGAGRDDDFGLQWLVFTARQTTNDQ